MMKVCGITYAFTTNYGTCLQSYALQSAIERMDVCETKPEYALIPISKCPGYPSSEGGLKSTVKRVINKRTRKQFVGFEQKYMKYAPALPMDRFSEYNETADAFVCGSDVIWNPKYNHGVSAYYLDFAEKYAFSYAASFGQSEIDPAVRDRIAAPLRKLREISVREEKSAEIARECTGREVCTALDPVLLLDRAQWDAVAEKDNRSGNYIFVYTVNTSALLRRFVKKLRRQTGLKAIFSGGNAGAVLKCGILRPQTPERWLQLMRDAQYVVTDSFHGTAFAALYGKNAFTIIDGDPEKGFNMRMSNFLKAIGLEQRICTSVPETIDCGAVDYTRAGELLDENIRSSLGFLRRNLEAAYREKTGSSSIKED